jgi:hypothetical protein
MHARLRFLNRAATEGAIMTSTRALFDLEVLVMINAISLNKWLESIDTALHIALERPDSHSINALRQATHQVAAQCRDLDQRRERVSENANFTPIDADFEIRNSLERARVGIRLMYRLVSRASADKSKIFTALQKALDDVYTAANQLQWEIGEHDANCYPRGTPILVSNQDELDRALDAIRVEK